MIPIDKDPKQNNKPEISYSAIYYHFRKWSKNGSFETLWNSSIKEIKDLLNLEILNIDGTHTIAKKGGESAKYQGRRKAKTTNIIPILDANGYPIASTNIISGNHNDAYNLKDGLQTLFKDMRKRELLRVGAYFNGDSAFDTKDARKVCFNHGLIPNIAENKRNRKKPKRGRKRLFNEQIYKKRFGTERTWVWVDKFKRLLIRFERIDDYFFGFHCIAFAMINLRSLIG
jgi:transposase